jgi:hypothetical protein
MTPTALRELVATEITVPFLTALDALGLGETAGRQAYKRGDLPFRVLRIGKALRVPTRDLEVLLLAPDMDAGGPTRGAAVTTLKATGGPDEHKPLTS